MPSARRSECEQTIVTMRCLSRPSWRQFRCAGHAALRTELKGGRIIEWRTPARRQCYRHKQHLASRVLCALRLFARGSTALVTASFDTGRWTGHACYFFNGTRGRGRRSPDGVRPWLRRARSPARLAGEGGRGHRPVPRQSETPASDRIASDLYPASRRRPAHADERDAVEGVPVPSQGDFVGSSATNDFERLRGKFPLRQGLEVVECERRLVESHSRSVPAHEWFHCRSRRQPTGRSPFARGLHDASWPHAASGRKA